MAQMRIDLNWFLDATTLRQRFQASTLLKGARASAPPIEPASVTGSFGAGRIGALIGAGCCWRLLRENIILRLYPFVGIDPIVID